MKGIRLAALTVSLLMLEHSVALGKTCTSAQVGNNYTFHGTFLHTLDAPLKIVWLKDGSDVSFCIPGIGCSDNNERETSTSLKHLEKRNYEFHLFINNITPKEGGHWSLEYFGPALSKYPAPIFTCHLKLAGDNESEDKTTASTQILSESTTLVNNRNEEIKLEYIILPVLVIAMCGASLFLCCFACRKCSKAKPEVAKSEVAKPELALTSVLMEETTPTEKATKIAGKITFISNIAQKGWSKIKFWIATIVVRWQKTSSLPDQRKAIAYTDLKRNPVSHV